MARTSLKYPIYAKAADNGTSITYSDPKVLAKAISANININVNDVKLPADDATAESDTSFSDGTVEMGIDDIPDYAYVDLLGYIEGAIVDATTGAKEQTTKGASSPYVGFGFYGRGVKTKIPYWSARWLVKVQFSEPSDEFKTKGEKIEFLTPTIKGNILTASWDSTYWKEQARFSTEAACIAWLNAKAGLPVSASGGLTGLTMAGTGATLSPSFGSSTRYYTLGGLTGTSFTVTATAANHVIQLYDDAGTLLQTLTTGVASSAVAMASVGSKKFRIVATESGKTPQITEFIVVKTA